jgi:type IV pilus assembly protein PilY1
MDLSGNNWPPLGSAAGNAFGITATFNGDGSLNTTNDQALQDTITKIKALTTAGIQTYVIGLGAGVDPTLNPQAAATLTAMAVAGGTTSYFPATSAAAVTTDLQSILSSILASTQTTSSSAANTGNVLTTSSVVYEPEFISSDKLGDFTGNLLAYAINPNTGAEATTATWAAQPLLDSLPYTSRQIVTWNPTAGVGIPFEWANISGVSALSSPLTTNPSDTSGQDVVNYLRGSTAMYTTKGGKFRPRSHILGDIVDSQPVYVGAPSSPYSSTSYTNFKNTYANRTPIVYVGGNDGMLHAFNASTGNELFAFIPNGVYSNLTALTYPTYNVNHQFYVDGSPQAADVQFTSGTQPWHTLLQGGENDGGKTIYTLDVTNPAAATSESAVAATVLWEFTDSYMGYSYSAPTTTLTTSGSFITFFGNGYNSNVGRPFLYAVNPQTGGAPAGASAVVRIDLCNSTGVPATACSSSYANGLSTIEAMNTGGLPSAGANVIYAGDLQGNIWRVNIADANPTNWTVSLLFQARDSSGNRQPITSGLFLTLNSNFPQSLGTMILFGTGQFLGTPDLTTTGVQSLYFGGV